VPDGGSFIEDCLEARRTGRISCTVSSRAPEKEGFLGTVRRIWRHKKLVGVFREMLQFAITGLLALLLDLFLFALLVGLGIAELVANPVSMTVRLIVAFFLTQQWVFEGKGNQSLGKQASGFLVLAAGNIFVTEVALWAAITVAGGDLALALALLVKVLAIATTFAGRFWLSRRYVFNVREESRSDTAIQ